MNKRSVVKTGQIRSNPVNLVDAEVTPFKLKSVSGKIFEN